MGTPPDKVPTNDAPAPGPRGDQAIPPPPSTPSPPSGHARAALRRTESGGFQVETANRSRDDDSPVQELVRRFSALAERSPNPVIEVDRSGRILYANPSTQISFPDLPQARNEHPVLQAISAVTSGRGASGGSASFEIRVGSRWYLQEVVPSPDGQRFQLHLRDMTEQKQALQQLRHFAYHDPLTGLANRRAIIEKLDELLRVPMGPRYVTAVFFLDLDRFGMVNSTYGHQFGDRLLVRIADRLREITRPGDSVARPGADKYTLIFPYLNGAPAVEQLAARLLEAIRTPVEMDSHEVFLTGSLGIVVVPDEPTDSERILRDGDLAMQLAKDEGGNQARVYDDALKERFADRLVVANSLRRAVERDELVVFYQPKIDLVTAEIVSCEALVRWQHPEWGLTGPFRFIPVAEATGQIYEIERWVLRAACRQSRHWRENGYPDLHVGVNISANQFTKPNFPDQVQATLDETGLAPAGLELEITETAAMSDIDKAMPVLVRLREMGVRVSIDDFGTGYSSLAYLQKLPIHALKIDRAFVQYCDRSMEDAQITTSMITLAHNLKLRTVAEGVETRDQLRMLRDLGCDEVQGYLLGKPMPADAFSERLTQPGIGREA